jgi:hypothetical protein
MKHPAGGTPAGCFFCAAGALPPGAGGPPVFLSTLPVDQQYGGFVAKMSRLGPIKNHRFASRVLHHDGRRAAGRPAFFMSEVQFFRKKA